MADKKRYQVLTAAALIPTTGPDGVSPLIRTLYRGADFEADPNNDAIIHNLDAGYITEIGANAVAGVDGAGAPMVDDKRQDGAEPGTPEVLNDPGTLNEDAARGTTAPTRTDDKGRPAGKISRGEQGETNPGQAKTPSPQAR